MSLNQKVTAEVLSRLDWKGGLTRGEIARQIRESDDMVASDIDRLYLSLPEGRRFSSYEEAIDAVNPMSWEK